MRKIEEIAIDLAKSLRNFTSNYPGSPYREKAELAFQEFQKWENQEIRRYKMQLDRSWDGLYKEVIEILGDEDASDKAREILHVFKIFHESGDTNRKLDEIIELAEKLKGSN